LRIGIAEIGSKTTRLMIADFDSRGDFRIVNATSESHGINLETTDESSLVKVNEIGELAHKFLDLFGCDKTLVYGTELCRQLSRTYGDKKINNIYVMSSGEEGKASWLSSLLCERGRFENKLFTVVDQGAGSLEILTAKWSNRTIEVVENHSFKLGHQLGQKMFEEAPNDHLNKVSNLLKLIETELSVHSRKNTRSEKVYLQGSVATKLAWLKVRPAGVDRDRYNNKFINGVKLNYDWMLGEYQKLYKMFCENYEEGVAYVDARPNGKNDFAMVVSNLPILLLLIGKIGHSSQSYVSGYGTRHGVAFMMTNKLIGNSHE